MNYFLIKKKFLATLYIFFICMTNCSINFASNGLDKKLYLSENLEDLISAGKLIVLKIPIEESSDISTIRQTGTIIMTREPDYVIIIGDQNQIDAIKALGFSLIHPSENDHKLRAVKIWVSDKEQIRELRKILSDLWPVGDIPGYVYGGAFDFQIEWLQGKGYTVELRH